MTAHCEITQLSAAYGARSVLRSVTLTARSGQVLALVGPNGAGKSTLIRVLSGVMRAQSGTARLDNVDLLRATPLERARRVAVVPQLFHLPEAFTAGEIVLMGRAPHLPLWASESRHDCEIAWRAMQHAHIEALKDRRVDELSGGEQQRVVIARALAQEPQMLLLDEPTAHLDLKHQVSVLELVATLAHQHQLTVLMTIHDLNQAARYADQVALLHQGAILASGEPSAVFTAERLSQVYGVPVTVGRHPTHGTPLVAPI